MRTWLRNLLAPSAELQRLREENAYLEKRLRIKTRELLRTRTECDALHKRIKEGSTWNA